MILEVIISPKGETRVETKGFMGSSCRGASRAIEEALGKQTNEHLTREYFEFTAAEQSLQQRQLLPPDRRISIHSAEDITWSTAPNRNSNRVA